MTLFAGLSKAAAPRADKDAAIRITSRDIGPIWRTAEGLEYAVVGINEGVISTAIATFGGMRESSIGR